MAIDTIYIESKSVILSAHSVKSYISAYDKHILPIFDHREISTINCIDYQKFADNLLRSYKKPKTVKNILHVTSGIYKFAIKNNWYEAEIYSDLV